MISVSAFNVNQLKSRFKTELERHYTKNWLQEINGRGKKPYLEPMPYFKKAIV